MTPTHPKMKAVRAAGAATVVLVWALHELLGVDVPPEVAAALTSLLVFAAGWLRSSG